MDLFNQPSLPPQPKVRAVASKPVPKQVDIPIIKPKEGFVTLKEDITSKFSKTTYGRKGDQVRIYADAGGPLLVLESEKTGRFSVKREQILQ